MTRATPGLRAVAAVAAVRPVHPDGRADRAVGAQAAAKPQAPTASRPAAAPSAAPAGNGDTSAAAPPAPVDGGWPRLYDLPSGGTILVYQPQVASWEKQTHLVAFSAVSHRAKAGDKPAVGTIKLEADTQRRRSPSGWSASRR